MNELFISCSMEIGVMLEAVTSDIEGVFYNMTDTVPRFAARRSYRPGAMQAGLGFFLVCAVSAVALSFELDRAEVVPWLAGIGAVGFFIASLYAMVPQQVTIAIAGKTVTPSWRTAIAAERIELGNWVLAGIGAATGLVVTVRGPGGTLRIGGEGHDGEGYPLGAPVTTVDCQLPKQDFEELVTALGIERGPSGPLAVPLIRHTQSFVGLVRGMAPWLVTISVLGVFGIVVGNTAWGEAMLRSPDGQLVMVAVCGGVAVFGVGWMIVRGRRVRLPELELRDERDALIIHDTRRDTQERAAWNTITVEKRTHSVSSRVGSYSMPVLVLTIPDRKPLRLGAWDTTLAWQGEPAKTWRAPTWIVGAAKWPKLLDLLKRRSRL